MSNANDIVLFHQQDITPDSFSAPLERRLAGECQQTVEMHYSDPTGQFHAGLWSGGVGAWRVKYTECEFCTLLEGRVRMHDDHGGMVEIVEPDGRRNRAVLGQVAHQFRRPVERAAADIGDGDRARVFRFLHRNIQGLRLWGGPQGCPVHRRPFSS